MSVSSGEDGGLLYNVHLLVLCTLLRLYLYPYFD